MTFSSGDRRQERRVLFPCQAHAFGDGERMHEPHIADLSASGAFIETPSLVPVGTTVLLRFRAAGADVKLEAEVVHVEPERGVGIRFVAVSPSQREALDRALSAPSD